nr:MAG TPA: hypothetical protein [Caudoviricetes sp.]
MKLFEMEGFLRGKCLPGDLKVNETNAEYLVRKFAEADARCAALAAENSGMKSAIEKHADSYIMCGYCRTERDGKNDDVCEVLDLSPSTDAFLAEVRASAFNDLCAEFVKHKTLAGLDDNQKVTVFEAIDALLHCAEQLSSQLRKGVQS